MCCSTSNTRCKNAGIDVVAGDSMPEDNSLRKDLCIIKSYCRYSQPSVNTGPRLVWAQMLRSNRNFAIRVTGSFNLTTYWQTQLLSLTAADQLPFIHRRSAVEAICDIDQPAFGFV